MTRYEALETVAFGPGNVLGLTVAQARVRAHALTDFDSGKKKDSTVVKVTVGTRVELKAGEAFQFGGDVSRALGERLRDLDAPAKDAAASPQGGGESRPAEGGGEPKGPDGGEDAASSPGLGLWSAGGGNG